jgi:hypothetical protein
MSFTIPAISIAIPSFVLIILLFSYVAISTYIIFWVSIGSGIPFMGSGWKQNVIWYIIFFPGTIIILLGIFIIISIAAVTDFLTQS